MEISLSRWWRSCSKIVSRTKALDLMWGFPEEHVCKFQRDHNLRTIPRKEDHGSVARRRAPEGRALRIHPSMLELSRRDTWHYLQHFHSFNAYIFHKFISFLFRISRLQYSCRSEGEDARVCNTLVLFGLLNVCRVLKPVPSLSCQAQ